MTLSFRWTLLCALGILMVSITGSGLLVPTARAQCITVYNGDNGTYYADCSGAPSVAGVQVNPQQCVSTYNGDTNTYGSTCDGSQALPLTSTANPPGIAPSMP